MIETSRTGRILALSFVLALSGAVTPGPMLAQVVAQVLARGMGAVWPILLGHVFVAVVLVTGRGWLTDGVYRLLVTGCAAAVLLVALLFLGLGVHTLLAVNRSR